MIRGLFIIWVCAISTSAFAPPMAIVNVATASAEKGVNELRMDLHTTTSPILSTNTLPSLVTSESLSQGIDVTPPYPTQQHEDTPSKINGAGDGFFYAYIIFSFLAGIKEFSARFSKWMENKNNASDEI